MKFEFKEETPSYIEDLKKKANIKYDANQRLEAISELGAWKCRQSIDILWRRMISDKLFKVQEQAFLRLQSFGEDVKLPRKAKGKLVKDIEKKVTKVLNSVETEVQLSEFKELLKNKYPEEYDLYLHDKGAKFDNWIANTAKSLPNELKSKISDL